MDRLIVPALMHSGQYLVSLTLIVLAAFSVYSLSVIGERWWTFRRVRTASARLLPHVFDYVELGRVRQALAACETAKGSPVAAVLAMGLQEYVPAESPNPGLHAGPGLERVSLAAREAMQRTTAVEIERLEQHLTSLATLGEIS